MTMTRFTFFVPTAVVILLSIATTFTQEKASIFSASNIRSVDFRNVELSRALNGDPLNGGLTLRFTNGSLETRDLRGSLMRITYGDLNGDGKEEAALLVRVMDKENAVGRDEIYIVSYETGEPTLYTKFSPTKPGGYVLSIGTLGSNFKIENGLLTIDVVDPEKRRIPLRYSTVKFRISLDSIQVVERSRLRKIPDNMRETG
jgi:hypothetical protein